VTGPEVAGPEVTGPEVTGPEVTGPEVAGSEVAGSEGTVRPARAAAAGPDPEPGTPSPVTVVVTRRVRAGREADYEAWVAGLVAEVEATLPGFLGAELRAATGRAGSPEYTSVFRFDSVPNLRRFEASDLRAAHLARVGDLVESDAVWNRLTGLELWFSPPAGTVVPQPVRWRMVVLLVAVVYLLVLAFSGLATALVGDTVPPAARLFVVIAVEVTLLTYVIMPVLTRRLSRWIYPTDRTVGAR
jgi:antibiotic biosynthesis monooxygenase (ABM) superfamily enzyme